MKTITYKQLEDKGACFDELILFKNTFGDSVEVTVDLAVSMSAEFDFIWAARNLLSPFSWDKYNKARASAQAEYKKATSSALAKYKEGHKYERVRYAAWDKYEKVCAKIFAELYLKDK